MKEQTKKLLRSNTYLIIEFLLLCLALPGVIIVTRSAPFMFAFLWGAAGYCFFIYRLCFFTTYSEIWNWDAVKWPALKPLLIRWVLASIGMVIFLHFYDPDRMFFLALNRPAFLPLLMLLYPVISALPQEWIFCSFFFKRYERYFGGGKAMILASALCFAYAHILYINPIAPTLSLLGGLIFAQTFRKHKSLALVTIEHGLYGNSLFVIGLGWYFYSGAVH